MSMKEQETDIEKEGNSSPVMNHRHTAQGNKSGKREKASAIQRKRKMWSLENMNIMHIYMKLFAEKQQLSVCENTFDYKSRTGIRKLPFTEGDEKDITKCCSMIRYKGKDNFYQNCFAKYDNDELTSWCLKELGLARMPLNCHNVTKGPLVEQSTGENVGLVSGDYVTFQFRKRKQKNWTCVNVCVRGAYRGMHLLDLNSKRSKGKTWKLCFYQAMVALLAKTQIKYEYMWSANIDYIYELALSIFNHVGTINVKTQQIFEDVVVYNYKFNVEIKLLTEFQIFLSISESSIYSEKNLKDAQIKTRDELMRVNEHIGFKDSWANLHLHKTERNLQNFLDKYETHRMSCIFKTERFSLSFWHDGLFWYLYNPFRCDKFGIWSNKGYACIVKFCSKESLRRHLIILLHRAYVNKTDRESNNKNQNQKNNAGSENTDVDMGELQNINIKIFELIYHSCHMQNSTNWQHKLVKTGFECKKRKSYQNYSNENDWPSDTVLWKGKMETDGVDMNSEVSAEKVEKLSWLKECKVIWSNNQNICKSKKMRWHQFYVEKPHILFSLWANVHPTDETFVRENRGNQIYACYVVCCGMTRIIAPEYWTSETLNSIVCCGDRYYTFSLLDNEVKLTNGKCTKHWSQYLSRYFKIGEILFEVKFQPTVQGKLYIKSTKCLQQSLEQMFLKYNHLILICERVCLSLFKFCREFYMYDVQSIGPPIFQYGYGVAYLIRATCFSEFLKTLILTIRSSSCSNFFLTPLEIVKIIDTNSAK